MDGIGHVVTLKAKFPCALQLSSHFAAYISSAYNQDPKEYMTELKQLDAMRDAAINAPLSANSPALLIKYICELQQLPSRFPVDADNIKLAIGWYNSWQNGDKPKPLAIFSLQYEQAAVMFNLAVMLSRLGNQQIVGDKSGKVAGDALKAACNYYLQAAGVFKEICSLNVVSEIPANCDLHENILKGMVSLMLAQAQECCYWKGVGDGSKEGALAKVAFAAHEFYGTAVTEFANLPAIANSQDGRMIVSSCSGKATMMHIHAELCKASDERSSKKFADELGRLQFINDVLVPKLLSNENKELQKMIRSIQEHVLKECVRAKKDNQLIYHEIPTTQSMLPQLSGFALVKPIGFTACREQHTSLFDSLIPLRLHQAMTRYQRAKQERVNQIVSELDRCKSVIESTCQKNNLPGALEAVEQPIGLPESLKSKMRELQSHGGLSGLQASIDLIKQLSAENNRVLVDAEELLSEESRQDEQYRHIYGNNWKRPRSRQAASTYHDKIDQVRQAMRTAADADAVIHSRLERYGRDLEVMCLGDVEAVSLLIPASHPSNRLTPAARVALERMRQWMQAVDGLLVVMQRCMTDVQSQSDHDNPIKALSGAASESAVQSVIQTELAKYAKYSDSTRVFMDRIHSLISSLEGLILRDFKQSTFGTGADSADRLSALQRLDDAYKHYLLINKDLADGIKFYTNLQDPLLRLRSDIADFATCRQVEAEELGMQLGETRTASMSPLRTPSEAFPAASAPSAPWNITMPVGSGVYPQQGGEENNRKQFSWMPGMPINYANKKT